MERGIEKLPTKLDEWKTVIKQRKLENKNLHAAELASASKIGLDQFLLFRVLWETHKTTQISLPEKVKKFLPEAKKLLKNYSPWKSYCDSFNKIKIQEGSFAVARHYQQMVLECKPNIRPNSFDTPISKRTRSQVGSNIMNIAKLQLREPKTPEKRPTTPDVLSGNEDSTLISEYDFSPDADMALSYRVPAELQDLMFPPTRDEQIVNCALLVFLDALTIHFDVCKTCNWSLHRKSFTASFTNASSQAWTDGYLDGGNEEAYAIIEVKPVSRSKYSNPIRMQESAQMVGWIMSESDNDVSKNKLRIHISQDRHEIYITLAMYGPKYIAYLKGEYVPEEAPSFLTMNQYGPWDIRSVDSMKSLGPILLAISLYAAAEIRESKKR